MGAMSDLSCYGLRVGSARPAPNCVRLDCGCMSAGLALSTHRMQAGKRLISWPALAYPGCVRHCADIPDVSLRRHFLDVSVTALTFRICIWTIVGRAHGRLANFFGKLAEAALVVLIHI